MLQMLWTRALLDGERMMLVAKNRRISFMFCAKKPLRARSHDRLKKRGMMDAMVFRH